MRSEALMGIGDRDKARDELELITKSFPQNPDARYQTGYLAYQDKNYKKAEPIFADLYKSNPRDTRGMIGLTEAMAAETPSRLNEAIKLWEAAIQKEPERRDLKMFVANMYVRAERYDEAIKVFNTLLEKDPKSADVLFRLAETQRRKGDLNAAIDGFRRCGQAAPTNTQCLIELGVLMDGIGKRDQSKPIYEQILKLRPDDAVALNNLAFIKAEEGSDLDAALTMAGAARRKSPNSPEIADTLGWIYIKRNQSEEAVRVFEDLVQKNPNVYTFHYHYGMALLQKGDKVSAKRELELAMKDKPSKEDAAKIEELLKGIRI
jgi:Flp pilus assembly protein TadD